MKGRGATEGRQEWSPLLGLSSVLRGLMVYHIATEISSFVPPETKDIWRDKIPMGREGEAPSYTSPAMLLATLLGVTSSSMAGTVCHNVGGGSETSS